MPFFGLRIFSEILIIIIFLIPLNFKFRHSQRQYILNPLPDISNLVFSSTEMQKRYDVKNIDKWGHNYLIE